jgi:hypothetical protein
MKIISARTTHTQFFVGFFLVQLSKSKSWHYLLQYPKIEFPSEIIIALLGEIKRHLDATKRAFQGASSRLNVPVRLASCGK